MDEELANPDAKLIGIGFKDFDPEDAWELYKEKGFMRPCRRKGEAALTWNRKQIRDFLIWYVVDYKKARVSFKIYNECENSIDVLILCWEEMGIEDDVRN